MTRPRRYRPPRVTVRVLEPIIVVGKNTTATTGDIITVTTARAVELRMRGLAEPIPTDTAGAA